MVLAGEFYDQHFRGKGLAPRHASGLKKELMRAIKAGESPMPVAKAFLKTKGIKAKIKETAAPITEKPEYEEVAADKANLKKEKAVVFAAPADGLDVKLLRDTLKALERASGVKLEPPADAKPEVLRRFIHQQMVACLDPESSEQFSKIEGGKAALFNAIDNCVGICIDLRNALCVVCPDQTTCVQTYFTNLRDGFSAIAEKHGLALREEVKPEDLDTALAPEKIFVIFDTANPFSPGTVDYAVAQVLLHEGTAPLGSIRETIGALLGSGSIGAKAFRVWLTLFTEKGIGCLAEELPEEVVATLSKSERKALGL